MRFARIQGAYEVLIDEQERAWYDNHRNDIVGEQATSECSVQVGENSNGN